MALEQLWQAYCRGGDAGVQAIPPANALESFYRALFAFDAQDIAQAMHYASQAARQAPEQLVFAQAAAYLQRILPAGRSNVYVDDAGFAAFIRGGGNLPLYARVSAALRQIYQTYPQLRLFDIGVGDGRALLPALTANISQLDVLEPSAAMLRKLCALLDQRGLPYQASCCPLQEFVRAPRGNWDVIQATFSLQSLSPQERPALLAWLRAHGQRVLLVEFDVPAFDAMFAPDRVQSIVARYARGLAEYEETRDRVAQGFLMPVFFGYFDQTAQRTNYEQPLTAWVQALQAAGFRSVQAQLLYSYWWAPAYLLDAS